MNNLTELNKLLRNFNNLRSNCKLVDNDMIPDPYSSKEGYEIYQLDSETYIKLIYDIDSYGREEFQGITFVKPKTLIYTDFEEI